MTRAHPSPSPDGPRRPAAAAFARASRRWPPALVAAAALLLGGCAGGGGGAGGEGDVEDGEPLEDGEPRREPDPGTPVAAGLLFVVAEDEVLDGVLGDATRPGATSGGRYGVSSPPSRGSLELLPDGRTFRYTPQPDFNGTDAFEYRSGEEPPQRATIDVTPVPDAPVLAEDLSPLVAERGVPFSRRLEADDADGDPLVFEARGLPGWVVFDPASGELSGVPGEDDVGRVEGIAFAVSDPSERRDERTGVVLEVVRPVDAPVLDLSRFPASLDGGERQVVDVFDDGADTDGVTLAIEPSEGRPDGALDLRVDGRQLIVEAGDVATVTTVSFELVLTDRLGEETRSRLSSTIHPVSDSGLGVTLLGSREGPGVHLVVLGDGYLADQQALLRDDAEGLIELLREDPATARHLGAFNIHVVRSVSEMEGAVPAGLPSRFHSTAFGSRYGCADIPQLICADALAVFDAADRDYDVDHVALLVNDERFGGSGSAGGIAIAARGLPGVVLHELGHSLAGLGDEYVDGALVNELSPDFVEGLFPNVTAIADPARAPWAAWIEPGRVPREEGESGVGLFEGGLYRERGVFRPTSTSRMRAYDEPFGPVNGEQWVLGVYAVNTVRDFTPQVFDVALAAGETAAFSVTPFFPPDVQAIEWWLDGERLRRADDARELEITPPLGTHELRLVVRDVSGLIRVAPEKAQFEWIWTIEVR